MPHLVYVGFPSEGPFGAQAAVPAAHHRGVSPYGWDRSCSLPLLTRRDVGPILA